MWNPFKTHSKRDTGNYFEKQACRYLKQHGLTFEAKNINFRFGEIDLLMRDKEQLVFIEVRFRHSNQFGGSVASVDKTKQAKLIKAAQLYLQKHYKNQQPSCRFDVVAFQGSKDEFKTQWIKNAFY